MLKTTMLHNLICGKVAMSIFKIMALIQVDNLHGQSPMSWS